MSETDYDVIVVGGGPIGSIASLSLSERGLRVCLVEKNINPYPFPRGIALNGFTMGVIKETNEYYNKLKSGARENDEGLSLE